MTFALDIGTRSVTGVLLKEENATIQLIDYCMIEHSERSMRDGQIHDVIAVADTIKEVKKTLEKRLGYSLHKVCIAAAGRSLKTVEASASIDLRKFPIKTEEDEKHLELSALQAAQEKLVKEEEQNSYNHYYCVGYSLLYYKLDQERIGSLIEQKGMEANADIIATFLPKVVVESLFAAIVKADLEVEAMTLEPIAALHVLIPESMRRLNVVLVDIGAGTSDIAITDRSTVVSYGMVPVAGDEVTEKISDEYLLDFPEAEQVKRNIVTEYTTEIEDILGMTTELSYEEFTLAIDEELEQLAKTIANEIQRLNEKIPRAVMLVGGGSLTPNLPDKLAKHLDLPKNRVAIRGVEAIQTFHTEIDFPGGPAFVTPIGIGITAKERPVQYTYVTVNGETIRLFEVNQLTVGDSLVQAGYEINKYYGKPGLAAILTVNGKEVTIPGEFGSLPSIYLNNRLVSVDTPVEQGDEITIAKGIDGRSARMSLEELIGVKDSFEVIFQGKVYPIGTRFTVNETEKPPTYMIQDKDTIQWDVIDTVQDFLEYFIPHEAFQTLSPIFVNGKQIELTTGKTKILINREEASLDKRLMPHDSIELIPSRHPTIKDLFQALDKPFWKCIEVTFNNEPVSLKKPICTVESKNGILSSDSRLEPRERLSVRKKESLSFVFQDVFRYVDIDLTNVTGTFNLYCNELKAAFDTVIHHGDQLAIIWSK